MRAVMAVGPLSHQRNVITPARYQVVGQSDILTSLTLISSRRSRSRYVAAQQRCMILQFIYFGWSVQSDNDLKIKKITQRQCGPIPRATALPLVSWDVVSLKSSESLRISRRKLKYFEENLNTTFIITIIISWFKGSSSN